MNFAQKAIDPLRDSFFAMPMASRLITAMLVATIAVGLGLLVKTDSSAETEHLFGGRSLSESEVDSVELAFSQAGLRSWVREGRRIRVPTGTRSEYLAALRESATLPLTLRSSVQEAIDKASPFESSDQRLARETHAKAQDLGATIMEFPDVRWASIVYDRGERTGLSRNRPQSASVFVSPEGAAPLSKARINIIKEMVRGAYAGMTGEEVVVTDANAAYVSGHGDDEDPMLRKRREEETAYEQKVLRALVGYGPIRVAAHAELDPTMGVEKATLKYDPPGPSNRYPRRIDSLAAASQRPHGPSSEPAGAIGNRATALQTLEHAAATKQDEEQSVGMLGQQYELSKLASLQVRRVRIYVGLPTSYYDKVLVQDYLRENPGKSIADMPQPTVAMLQQKRSETEEKIKAAVAQLLPLAPPGEDPYPLVHVSDYPDFPEPALAAPVSPNHIVTWFSQSWSTLATLGLAIIAIFTVRSALRSSGSAPPAERFSNGFAAPIQNETAASDDDLPPTKSPLKDELQRMVDKNPEVAANVLRSWMAEAA